MWLGSGLTVRYSSSDREEARPGELLIPPPLRLRGVSPSIDPWEARLSFRCRAACISLSVARASRTPRSTLSLSASSILSCSRRAFRSMARCLAAFWASSSSLNSFFEGRRSHSGSQSSNSLCQLWKSCCKHERATKLETNITSMVEWLLTRSSFAASAPVM